MATHESCAESVPLRGEMSGDQGEDIRREAVYGNEGVNPLVDGRQCGQGIPFEFQNLIQGEPIREVSIPFHVASRAESR